MTTLYARVATTWNRYQTDVGILTLVCGLVGLAAVETRDPAALALVGGVVYLYACVLLRVRSTRGDLR